mmetsp:Transcript_10014/g.26592  ORF Transcript_10014/g.26592 Transcript_10014/m.26592 type:complete len:400 (+) Transcript_10014:149-1348(+)|eukprot:CAMPEP_0117480234 /NCGR_PEP_ID=MMETSP0784-20121206/12288_1 /TAXON_ID=39447 /ORGANISM="" /LENGTH=399 /DNA_ID=CAMNT_0005274671 /DNA_START=76 /DNA_END=1275 /DNA_ORIENTATION=-
MVFPMDAHRCGHLGQRHDFPDEFRGSSAVGPFFKNASRCRFGSEATTAASPYQGACVAPFSFEVDQDSERGLAHESHVNILGEDMAASESLSELAADAGASLADDTATLRHGCTHVASRSRSPTHSRCTNMAFALDLSQSGTPQGAADQTSHNVLFSTPRLAQITTPPTTPRPVQRMSPPVTPKSGRRYTTEDSYPASPPPAPRGKLAPPLLHALIMNDPMLVSTALAQDPDAAIMPFMDHDWEPPLCSAARLGCSTEVVSLLIRHGASINGLDSRGRTPLGLVSSTSRHEPRSSAGSEFHAIWRDFEGGTDRSSDAHIFGATRLHDAQLLQDAPAISVAGLLLEARADPMSALDGDAGRCISCVELAEVAGNDTLVDLFLGRPFERGASAKPCVFDLF